MEFMAAERNANGLRSIAMRLAKDVLDHRTHRYARNHAQKIVDFYPEFAGPLECVLRPKLWEAKVRMSHAMNG